MEPSSPSGRREGATHSQTTAAGRYAFAGIQPGDYLVKAEKTGMALLYGAVHVKAEDHHDFDLVLAQNPSAGRIVKAESPYDLPAQQPRLPNPPPRNVKPARPLKQVAPKYPGSAKLPEMRAGGRIVGIVRADGAFDNIVVLSAPTADLALAILSAVRQWRYSPAYVDGRPVEVITITDVNFHPW